MQTYFSIFITGFSAVVEQALKQEIKDVHIDLLSDGLVVYKTDEKLEVLKQIRFFNNSFILLKLFPRLGSERINEMLKQSLKDDQITIALYQMFPGKKIRFRVMATEENQFVAMDRELKTKFEEIVLQLENFVLDRSFPDVELLFMARHDGQGLLGLRFTHHTSYEKILAKGEIYPELAHILCLISEPQAEDIFLDPFCGSGAIPVARAIGFPYQTIYASDNSDEAEKMARSKAKKTKKTIIVKKWDALHLTELADASIDKIVTDPPWGLYSGLEFNLEQFYTDMLTEFRRVLKPNGILVVLVAKKELFESIVNKFSDKFTLVKKYTTLVSGQKAGVYKIRTV